MQIERMIQDGRRRLYGRRFVQKIAIMTAVTLVICAILIALIRFGIDFPGWIWILAAVPASVLLIWSVPWRISDTEVARQIDAANQFGDRISSALSFMRSEQQTEWMKIQIADTQKRLESPERQNAFVKNAFSLQKPEHLKLLAGAAAASILIVFIPDIDHAVSEHLEEAKPPQTAITEEPQPIAGPNLDAVSQQLRQHQIEALLEEAQEIDDPELKEAAQELAQILEDDRAGKLSAEEFKRRLAALEKKLSDSDPAPVQEQKAFDQAVRDAVESMTQMKEDPETEELAKALEKNDYDTAADILRDLLNSTDPKDKQKLEKLAKMFKNLARNLDPTDPELKKALQKNKDLVNQLKKELNNDKLTDEDKKAFKDAAKKLDDAEKQQQQQQQQANNQAEKALDKLSKAMNKTSKDLEKQSQDAESEQDPNAQAKKSDQPQDAQDGDKEGQKEGKKEGQQGQQKEGQQGQEGQQQQGQEGQQQQGQEGQQQQGQQKEGQQGQEGQQQGQEGQQEQDSAGQNGEQTAEDALREAAENKRAQEKRDALKDLADKMRQDAKQAEEQQNDEAKQDRQKNMQDFMDRAKGQDQQDQQQQDGQQQDGQQQDGQQQGGQQQGGQQQQQDGQQDSQQQGQQNGQENGMNDSEPGLEPSSGHDTTEGDATSMKVNLKDEKLSGMDTGQQSTSEIIESAGQKGFASESYKEVYQTYEKAAEEILESEEVPQGYRNYVEKYFDMIRPQ